MLSGVPQGSVLGLLLFLIYIDCIASVPLTGDSKLVLYADDVLLFKPICHPDDYIELQTDINTIHQCVRECHLTLNPSKCKVLIASKKRTPTAPLLLDGRPMEQVSNYRYLGVMVTSKLSWYDHIQQICTKARRLVGMLYRQFYCWADTTTLLTLYIACIRPHLEYACTLWDPYTCKETHMIESVQKFACKVCLKCWDLNYDAMLHLLGIYTPAIVETNLSVQGTSWVFLFPPLCADCTDQCYAPLCTSLGTRLFAHGGIVWKTAHIRVVLTSRICKPQCFHIRHVTSKALSKLYMQAVYLEQMCRIAIIWSRCGSYLHPGCQNH